MKILHNDWEPLLAEEFEKPYYKELRKFVVEEYQTQWVYPPVEDVFNALHLTPYKEVKIVILGQDPYHQHGQAHGLAFSVQPDVRIPPSLQNIYKELHDDLGCTIPSHGYLEEWSRQGVLLLNTALTVRASLPNSHQGKGWEAFTDRIIQLLNQREEPVVFILWGRNAQRKTAIITNPQHYIIQSVHPSPLSAFGGFFGSKPFSKANAFLRSIGQKEIDWQIHER